MQNGLGDVGSLYCTHILGAFDQQVFLQMGEMIFRWALRLAQEGAERQVGFESVL